MSKKNHIHQWQLDRQGNAKCACGATRRYGEPRAKLNMGQRTMVHNISFYWPSWDPDSPMCATGPTEISQL